MFKLLQYFLIIILFKIIRGHDNRPSKFCMNVNPQKGLDLEKILGLWYGNDIIEHSGYTTDPGIYYYDTCAEISISNVRLANYEKQKYSRYGEEIYLLNLYWEERGYPNYESTSIEYSLQFNRSSPGLWETSDKQKGFSPTLKYNQFNGTIQVVKAIKDQLVLTFCGLKMGETFFSIILTRTLQPMPFEDLEAIYKLLKRRGLSTDHVRRVCQPISNNSSLIKSSTFLLILIILFIFTKN